MRRKKYGWALAGLVALAGTGVVVTATQASAAETVTQLPISDYGSALVDDANHHVYVTAGERADILVVLDQHGTVQKQITVTAADGLALSPDSRTLYVAEKDLSDGGILAIDAATLEIEQEWKAPADAPDGVCPTYLAAAGDQIYFSYGCGSGQGNLGSLDPATGTFTLGLGAAVAGPARLDAHGGKLVAAEGGAIDLYDITSGTPVLTHSVATDPSWCFAPRDLSFSADGGRILLACQAPDQGVALSSADLSVAGSFPSGDQPPLSIAGSGDGSTVAVGTTTNYAPKVWIDSADGTSLRDFPLPAGETVAKVLLSRDGNIAYAVSFLSAHNWKLHLFTADAQVPSLTLTGPAKVERGQPVALTGTFGGGAGKRLGVTRSDLTGNHVLDEVTTGENGAFTVTDTPASGGDNVYTVAFGGDDTWAPAQASATVTVARLPASVLLTTTRKNYAYGATPQATVRVAHTTGTVCLSTTQMGTITCTETDSKGVARIAVTPFDQNTTLTATFAGNDAYAPAVSNRVKITSAALVQESMNGSYGSDGKFCLFHQASDVELGVTVAPYRPGATVRFTEQVLAHGRWHTVATKVVELDGNSETVGNALGRLAKNQPYRIRASFVADATNAASDGPWMPFKITG